MNASNILVRERADAAGNSWVVLAMFWTALLFQDTGLKFVWGLELEARIANLAAVSLMSVYAMYALLLRRFPPAVWYLYLLPGLLVFAGMLINITWNTILDVNVASYYGLVLPWAAYLIAPVLIADGRIDSRQLWRLFYYFMVTTVLLGLSDYVSVLADTGEFRLITTPNGEFLAGRFSLLHMLEDGTPHARFYGWFIEPGTLAMFLLPALAYAMLNKRYIGVAIMLVGFYFTGSLGGIIGLTMLFAVLAFVKFNKGPLVAIPAALAAVILAITLWANFGADLVEAYDTRADSRTVREDDVKKTLTQLPEMLASYPLGFALAKGFSEGGREFGVGTNFTVGNALQVGGLSGFFGYVTCLLVSFGSAALALLTPRTLSTHEKVVFSSVIVLLPFVVQRTVIWDSPMFAFLIAPSIIGVLRGRATGAIHNHRDDGQVT